MVVDLAPLTDRLLRQSVYDLWHGDSTHHYAHVNSII